MIAPSGAGKTTFIEYLGKKYPDVDTPSVRERPVVHFRVPSSPTPKQMGAAFLKALGDPLHKLGNAEDKKFRIGELLPRCKTQIIAIDDFQDVPARRGQLGVKAVGDWVWDLFEIKFTGTIMAFGTEAAAVVRDSNDQLGRRMMSRMDLPLFNVDTDKNRDKFRSLLRSVDASIPLALSSGLDKPDLMAKLFFASGGNFDYLIKLITHAMIHAVGDGRESISAGDLEAGFKDLHQVAALQGNPFSGDFDGKPLDTPGQIFHRAPAMVNDQRTSRKSRSAHRD